MRAEMMVLAPEPLADQPAYAVSACIEDCCPTVIELPTNSTIRGDGAGTNVRAPASSTTPQKTTSPWYDPGDRPIRHLQGVVAGPQRRRGQVDGAGDVDERPGTAI
jgi:hypothetical protein